MRHINSLKIVSMPTISVEMVIVLNRLWRNSQHKRYFQPKFENEPQIGGFDREREFKIFLNSNRKSSFSNNSDIYLVLGILNNERVRLLFVDSNTEYTPV